MDVGGWMGMVRLAYQPGFRSLIKGLSSESDFKLKGRFRMLFAGYVLVPSICLNIILTLYVFSLLMFFTSSFNFFWFNCRHIY